MFPDTVAGVTNTITDITNQISQINTALQGLGSIDDESTRTAVQRALNAIKISLTDMRARFENYKTTLQNSRFKREAGRFLLFHSCNSEPGFQTVPI